VRRGLPEWFESNVDTHCLATSGSTAVFGTADGDVFVSTDEGITWETVGKGLPRVGCIAIAGGLNERAEISSRPGRA